MKRKIVGIVQARMSSKRFPGKVLAPLRGEPLIKRVVSAVALALPSVPIVVATSWEAADDPLATYLDSIEVKTFRGPLDNVFERFRMCVSQHSCDWILRVNADSPLLCNDVLQAVTEHSEIDNYDLITTVFPRTFPRGNNAELIRVSRFLSIDAQNLSSAELEHVTAVYYQNPQEFRILNLESGNAGLTKESIAVDTVEDLQRLEQMSEQEFRSISNASISKGGQ